MELAVCRRRSMLESNVGALRRSLWKVRHRRDGEHRRLRRDTSSEGGQLSSGVDRRFRRETRSERGLTSEVGKAGARGA